MKLTMEHSHPRMCVLTRAAKVLFHDAPDLQYSILLINIISHVATAVDHEVSQGSYVVWGSKLAKRQQAHAVIEIIINARLSGRLHCQNFTRQNH